jgi:hypothetical protein
MPLPIQGRVGLSNIQEIRRLKAYVAISEKEFRRCKNLDLVVCKTDANSIKALTASQDDWVVFGIIARRQSRYR